jgi:poly(3-hydroxyalkanoate) synthetase
MNKGTLFNEFLLDAMRIVAWLNDTPLIPACFFREYIGKLYQQNQLVKKELEITLLGEKTETVDLAKIAMPLLNIVGEQDDICTPPASIPINDIAASKDKELL